MDAKFTTLAQDALSEAIQTATAAGNPEVEPIHILAGLVGQADGVAPQLLVAAGVDAEVRRPAVAVGGRGPDQCPVAGGGAGVRA